MSRDDSRNPPDLSVGRFNKMLPCPFCGSPGHVATDQGTAERPRSYYALCTSCDCFCCLGEGWPVGNHNKAHMFDTRKAAIAAWNRRA